MTGPLVVVGDALLDVDLVGTSSRLCPDAPVPVVEDVQERPRAGGAALAAALAAADGTDVVLVAPLAEDAAAERLRAVLPRRVRLLALPFAGSTPVKQRVRVAGQSLLRLDTGGAPGRVGDPAGEVAAALDAAAAVLVSDYGRGASAQPRLRALLERLPRRVPTVWDPHPRGAAPVPGMRLVTPNAAEAAGAAAALGVAGDGAGLAAASARAEALVRAWQAGAVAVTLGRRGALLSYGAGAPLVVPAVPAAGGDPCGAGDRFAAAAAVALGSGAVLAEAVAAAVAAASAFVAAGGAAAHVTTLHDRYMGGAASAFVAAATSCTAAPSCTPSPSCTDQAMLSHAGAEPGAAPAPPLPPTPPPTPPDRLDTLLAGVRARGGTVVATGGCFDLLHAGHVATLRAARDLGDCLVVCINSDASVRRLKGPARPLVGAPDRRRVLEALACVDAVAVFDEDTPEALLDRLRPDVWAKGGDYAGVDLPEAPLLRRWGGQAVVLPYLDGRSTTAIVHSAAAGSSGPFPGGHREENA